MTVQLEVPILAGERSVAAGLYFVTNRLNLLEVLSTGYIAPRASYQKYYADLLELSPGRVPLVSAPIVASVQEASASTSEVFPVAIEIDVSKLSGFKAPALEPTGRTHEAAFTETRIAWAADFVIPLSWCRRVAFRSTDELREHAARKYENVPEDSVPLEVAPGVFASSGTRELLEWFGKLPAASGPSTDQFRMADRVSGARCASLAALPYSPRAASVTVTLLRPEAVKGKRARGKAVGDGGAYAPWISVSTIQGDLGTSPTLDEKVFSGAAKTLMSADKSAGWKPLELVEEIEHNVRSSKLTKRDSDELGKNLEAIRAIISNEREFRPFKKATGSDAAKALLLFLMRREPAKLVAWPSQETGADDAVLMTAAVFAGLFAGRSRLPLSMRPAAVDSALANLSALELSSHVPAARSRLAATHVAITEHADERGFASHAIALDGAELARWSPGALSLAERLSALDFADASNAAMAIEICRLLSWSDAVQSRIAIDTGQYAVTPASKGKGVVVTTAGWPRIETALHEGGFRARLSSEAIPQEREADVERLMKAATPRADSAARR